MKILIFRTLTSFHRQDGSFEKNEIPEISSDMWIRCLKTKVSDSFFLLVNPFDGKKDSSQKIKTPCVTALVAEGIKYGFKQCVGKKHGRKKNAGDGSGDGGGGGDQHKIRRPWIEMNW